MGELQIAPKNIVVKDPLTDQVFKDHIRVYWDDVAPYIVIYYELHDVGGRVLQSETLKIEGADLVTFVDGFGTTLKTRSEAAIWADIQDKYSVQDK